MRAIRLLTGIVIAAGLLICSYGAFHIWSGHNAETVTLKKAQALSTVTENERSFSDFNPYKGDTIGLLDLPKLKTTLPIVEGTTGDQLAKGVGHYKSSKFPGQHDQIVLSGHRDTVFRHVGELKKGDTIILHFPYGSFTYSVDHATIVMADDTRIIHSTSPKEELVLTTCYPFYYVGNAPKRYIIYAYPKSS